MKRSSSQISEQKDEREWVDLYDCWDIKLNAIKYFRATESVVRQINPFSIVRF